MVSFFFGGSRSLASIQAQNDLILRSLSFLKMEVIRMAKIEDDLVAAVAAERNETKAATLALQNLQAQIASLQATASAPGVDPAVVQQAIADLGSDATALAAAIPADAIPPAPQP